MQSGSLTIIQQIVIWALPVLFAITVHEVSHGWVANKLGDPTAKMLGRLTLNPIKHIDPLGTIIVPLAMMLLGGILFGWAKPVPISPNNLRGRRDMALVAVAGPISNLIMALLWALIGRAAQLTGTEAIAVPLSLMGQAGVFINVILAVLNLLPLPPLDGGRVVSNLLPPRLSAQYDKIEPYGFFILVGLLVIGALQYIMAPPIYFLTGLIQRLVGL